MFGMMGQGNTWTADDISCFWMEGRKCLPVVWMGSLTGDVLGDIPDSEWGRTCRGPQVPTTQQANQDSSSIEAANQSRRQFSRDGSSVNTAGRKIQIFLYETDFQPWMCG
jgi:hypothetical protein